MKANFLNKAVSYYQALYGFLGLLYNAYLLTCNTDKGKQVLIIVAGWLLFDVMVLAAGVLQYNRLKGQFILSFLVQFLQISSFSVGSLYLKFRCGISINLVSVENTPSLNFDFLDFTSALSWQLAPPSSAGLNFFAIAICVLLIFLSIHYKGGNTLK